ncbi:MAG: molybdopterin-binding protein [Chitinophagaceae bacterium]|nr:molybdopterin-binding protein [Chitinophagaceae bacterium]
MKYLILLSILCVSQFVSAQHDTKPTDFFTVEGKVKQTIKFTLDDATAFNSISFDSIVIYNHLVVRKSVLKKVKGVLLKDILAKSSFDTNDPKSLSEYYITCIASDGYKVVFSWNEIFNSGIGEQLFIITDVDGIKASSLSQRIAIISPSDIATGRRYVHGLSRIVVSRVESLN